MTTAHPIRCKCGKFTASIAHPERGTRAICYCRDCRAYAHFLGPPAGMLDAHGGTDVVAVSPSSVSFGGGVEHLACMSLSPRGVLRWFTSCCRTPIGNTPRDIRLAHLGLVHDCLEGGHPTIEASFGPVKMKVNKQSAHGDPGGTPVLPFAFAAAGYMAGLAWRRVGGSYRRNPLFDARTGAPIVEPRVLTREERNTLMERV